jgi:transcriptional regulator
MYSLPYFKEKDPARVKAFMRDNPFALLCGATLQGKPVATQVPLLIREDGDRLVFRGHFMKKTDHHIAFTENPDVLVLFTGAHEYVSASWYSDPAQASTWNYMTVHARGTMKLLSEAELLEILKETTSLFENNPDSPSLFESLAPEYVARLINAIVAFEIQVTQVENVFKLSQNRDKKSYENIIEKLKQGKDGAKAIASEMEKRTDELYS